MYELNAVLIHRGVSAYSGHYIAHVRDDRTKEWYKFNDEEIEKMEGKKLQLGIDDDIGKCCWCPNIMYTLFGFPVDKLFQVLPFNSTVSKESTF